MKTTHRTVLVGAALLLAAGAAFAQPAPPDADLTGTWTLVASASQPQGATEGVATCDFEGTAVLTQTDGALSGSASLDLVDGSQICPSTMSASLTGLVSGSDIQMGMLIDGGGGEASFTGQIDGPPPPAQGGAAGAMSLSGAFNVTQGPFVGYFGPWSAVPGGPPPVQEIPTLTAAGLALLALLLVGAAVVLLFRRRAA